MDRANPGTANAVAGASGLTDVGALAKVAAAGQIADSNIKDGVTGGKWTVTSTLTADRALTLPDQAVTVSAFGASLVDDTDASTARTTLGLAIGTNVQAYDAGLQSIAGLTTAADRMIYTTASDTYAVATLTAAGRALIDDASASDQRTTLGLTIGTNVQAYDAGLTSIAALTTVADNIPYTTASDTYAVATLTAAGRALIDDASASDQRTTLGLAIGTNVQAYDAGLTSIAGLTTAADRMIYTTASDTYAVATLTAAGRALIDDADAAAQRTTLGLATAYAHPVDAQMHGIVDRSETTIGFNDSTYVFTLTDAGSGWSYYRDGVKYTISGNKTVTLPGTPPTAGKYYIVIDATDGTLSVSTTVWTLIDSQVPVANVVWNDSLTPKYILIDERHDTSFSRSEHAYEHLTYGTRYQSGGALSWYTISTATDAANTYGIAEAIIWDEDYQHTLAALTDASTYHIQYRTAASTWAWVEQAIPFRYTASGYIQWDNAGTMTEGVASKFYNTYVLLTNAGGFARFVTVHGQGQFASLAAAQARKFSDLTLTGFNISEAVAGWQITWETSNSYSSTGKCRMAAEPVRISVNLVQAGAPSGLGTMSIQNADSVAITGGTITGITSLATTANGLDVNPGSDIDADLVTVGVTGAPRIWWDESEDAFQVTHAANIDGVALKDGGVAISGAYVQAGDVGIALDTQLVSVGTANKRRYRIGPSASDFLTITARLDDGSYVRSLINFEHDGKITVGGTTTLGGAVTMNDRLYLTSSTGIISPDTIDGSDNRRVRICGGGADANSRGGFVTVTGNDYSSGQEGVVTIVAGNAPASGWIGFYTGAASTQRLKIDYNGVVSIPTTTASTSATTGALVVTGDIATSGKLSFSTVVPASFADLAAVRTFLATIIR